MANKKLKDRILDYCNKMNLKIWISEYDGIVHIEDYDDQNKTGIALPANIRNFNIEDFIEMMINADMGIPEITEYLRNKKLKSIGI